MAKFTRNSMVQGPKHNTIFVIVQTILNVFALAYRTHKRSRQTANCFGYIIYERSLGTVLHSLDYAVNNNNNNNNKKKITKPHKFSWCFFAPTRHIYKPLTDKPKDHLGSDLFLLELFHERCSLYK